MRDFGLVMLASVALDVLSKNQRAQVLDPLLRSAATNCKRYSLSVTR